MTYYVYIDQTKAAKMYDLSSALSYAKWLTQRNNRKVRVEDSEGGLLYFHV